MIKGIIFDKDGTLFDFNATWGALTRSLIMTEVGPDPARMTEMAELLGYDLDAGVFRPGSIVIAEPITVVVDAMLTQLPHRTKTDLITQMKLASAKVEQVEPVPLRPVLQTLTDMGLVLGVATNDSEVPARANLSHVVDMFAFIAGFDSGFGGKPSPGQLHGFCAATGLAPADCIMVGDSTHDLDAGRAAGMRCVGVLSGPAPRAELAPLADVVLDTIGDLPAWVAAQNGTI